MKIYCDFDGTITLQDSTQVVLSSLADPAWLDVERAWENGQIGSAECMRRQIAMIRGGPDELDKVLDTIGIDAGFLNLVHLCEETGLSLTIVSDGVDYFIRRVLAHFGVNGLPIIANKLTIEDDGAYQLTSPYSTANCISAAGTCKCAVANATAGNVFIGDGRSDFCVAGRTLNVFAKGRLAEHCTAKNIRFTHYQTLNDVIPFLRDLPFSGRTVNAA